MARGAESNLGPGMKGKDCSVPTLSRGANTCCGTSSFYRATSLLVLNDSCLRHRKGEKTVQERTSAPRGLTKQVQKPHSVPKAECSKENDEN